MIYEFMATQSYNGYDKPWAGGTNVNLFDGGNAVACDNFYYNTVTDQIARGNGNCGVMWPCDPETIYTFSVQIKNLVDLEMYDFASETVDIGSVALHGVRSNPVQSAKTLTLTTDADAVAMFLKYDNALSTTHPYSTAEVFNTIQVEKGSSASPFTPYANVCMPEGFNIWDPTNQEYIQVYAGYVNANTRELYLRPVYEEYAGEELVGPWMSSLDPYEEDATPTEGAFVIDFGGELTSFEITPFMLQTLLDSLGIRQHFTDGAGLLNKLMDQAQGRVRSEEELLHLSRPLKVIPIGDQLPAGLTFKPISKDVLPGLPGKFIR